jgi:beta-galactosidase
MAKLFIAITVSLALLSSVRILARENILLDDGWRFQLGEVTDATHTGFDDRDWQSVSVPHNWGWEEAQQGRNYYRGPGWYRRELTVCPLPDKRCFLRFEAASLVADVYLNGTSIGQHRGGFGAFCFEITKYLSASGTNVLAVRVDNSKFPDIAPLSGDFSIYGGLYRPVHLIETGLENFELTDHGSPGVAWLQTSVTKTQAVLDVTAQVSNGTTNKQPLTLVTRVVDAAGQVVVSNSQSITLSPHATAPYFIRLTVPQPHLWNGRPDPYLYQATVELVSSGGLVDSVTQPLGLRSFYVDPEKGFFLNGKPYHLHGVNRHQDMAGKGWAISEPDQDTDIAMLKEIGATVVRCCHYQHSDYFYRQCDQAGILVWAELPQVNEINASPEFEAVSQSQLLDLIRQNINHPSIFVWSLFNELWPGNPDPQRELQDLNNLAHGEDPTRPTIGATASDGRPQMNRIPDLLGWNIYPGWYQDSKGDYGRELDKRKDTGRAAGFCVSEYGAGANTTQHEQNPQKPSPRGEWHPEEWQAELHEAAWPAIKARPFVWGSFVWCMFDLAVNSRHEGGQAGLNDKGLVTRDRKTKKDAFYYYQANWSDEPMVYITSRRFTERTNAVTDVKIYSNTKAVEVSVNGVSQGKRSDGVNGVFIWQDVTLKPGENKIEVHANRDGKILTDQCSWTLK